MRLECRVVIENENDGITANLLRNNSGSIDAYIWTQNYKAELPLVRTVTFREVHRQLLFTHPRATMGVVSPKLQEVFEHPELWVDKSLSPWNLTNLLVILGFDKSVETVVNALFWEPGQ